MTFLPAWVEETAKLPLAFAQVREDALLDLWVMEQIGSAVRVLLIASGGCTAAALAASGRVAWLHLVDLNPAQLALTRLKLHLLATAGPAGRAALLGHATMPAALRAAALAGATAALGLPADVLGPPALVAELGPDHAGRYERLFAHLEEALTPVADELDALLRLRDHAEQARRADAATPLGQALDEAFDRVLDLPILVRLFGEGATRNRREPFARHFARRTRHALATLPAGDNPFLWQMLRGRFPDGVVYTWRADSLPTIRISPVVQAFNTVIHGACALSEPETGLCCLGVIEQAFAGIAATIGRAVVARGWVRSGELLHYRLRAEVDTRHAEEFFAVAEPGWDDPRRRGHIAQGLELGAYVFDRLYRDLHASACAAGP